MKPWLRPVDSRDTQQGLTRSLLVQMNFLLTQMAIYFCPWILSTTEESQGAVTDQNRNGDPSVALLTWPTLPVLEETLVAFLNPFLSCPLGHTDGPPGGALDSSVILVIYKAHG